MKKLLLIVACTCLTSTALASVAEDKARKGSDDAMTQATASAKAACGNASLTGAIQWADYDKLEYGTRAKDAVFGWAANYASFGPQTMKDLCAADADYKKALSQITRVIARPIIKDHLSVEFRKNGSTLEVDYNPFGSNNSDAIVALKKQL
jgi:hypothetical protein